MIERFSRAVGVVAIWLLSLCWLEIAGGGAPVVADSTFQTENNIRYFPAQPVRFRFAMRGSPPAEDVVAVTSVPAVIQQCREQLALPVDQRHQFIAGSIAAGNGGYNLGWSWHFVPDAWVLADFSIELCDGLPYMVEADLNYWLNTVGSYCPWTAYVVSEEPCCYMKTGNVDCDPLDGVDISDLSALIDNLFVSFTPLCCAAEANVDSSPDGKADISDLSRLVDYLYITFTLPAVCQ
jgi:hypothetical protein